MACERYRDARLEPFWWLIDLISDCLVTLSELFLSERPNTEHLVSK